MKISVIVFSVLKIFIYLQIEICMKHRVLGFFIVSGISTGSFGRIPVLPVFCYIGMGLHYK